MKWEAGNNFEKVIEKTSSKWQILTWLLTQVATCINKFIKCTRDVTQQGKLFDAMSLAWSYVVQIVVSFNSGLKWGISQEYTFFVSSQ